MESEDLPAFNPSKETTPVEAPKDPAPNTEKLCNPYSEKRLSKKQRRQAHQKKWNETLDKLKKNVCPQCNKPRPKLEMRETYLDYILEASDEIKDIRFIACNKCWERVKGDQNEAIIQHKNMEIKLKDKDIKILRLKLDFYSDSEGDVEYTDSEEESEESQYDESDEDSDESSCPELEDTSDTYNDTHETAQNDQNNRNNNNAKNNKNNNNAKNNKKDNKKDDKKNSKKDNKKDQNDANNDKVFTFKNLKVNTKK